MQLPVMPPVKPMLAKPVAQIPPDMHYEAKWDGFRAIVFRDGAELIIGSRGEKPLTRYFPELVAELPGLLPDRCVLDGEIVLAVGDRLDFDALSQRIHPAASRVELLASQTPAALVAFDLLALGDDDLTGLPFARRRELLAETVAGAGAPLHLAPATTDLQRAAQWFELFEGAGLDGIVAKPFDIGYGQNRRLMYKIKHGRTADCVVAGYRWHKSGQVVGSLLLGLYNEQGRLQHVGVAASFSMQRRRELVDELAPYLMADPAEHPWAAWTDEQAHVKDRMPGAPSRWSGGKDTSWLPLRPELVCEVGYEHMQAGRFRHTARFTRWRTDREPASCTYAQLEEPVRYDIGQILR